MVFSVPVDQVVACLPLHWSEFRLCYELRAQAIMPSLDSSMKARCIDSIRFAGCAGLIESLMRPRCAKHPEGITLLSAWQVLIIAHDLTDTVYSFQ